ncbi:hypothetical protein Rsub_08191 [Raphidocelis subcapitata]|uniref:Zinc finger A20 and AN1 domain-containing stress-associated protein n=1 Tax=Raphidocelis subcapitata TaxID=307507 RepID=A0A2V0PF99_9CHLO|nr:hypothetical protein Rsub_08191 [Raphidocelis subcapitata]|eukprot:GBF95755.1 hypothetical protein Rsub_08191 [Raphidocelis subcapitata]
MDTNKNMPQLCSNSCGFFSNPSLNGLCSKCHRDGMSAQDEAAAAARAVAEPAAPLAPAPAPAAAPQQQLAAPASTVAASVEVVLPAPASPIALTAAAGPSSSAAAEASPAPEAACESGGKASTRCQQCRKKVGLTGFKCKCGQLFCGSHRYAEAHACTFDYKTAEREKLAAANPLVQAAKVQRI